MKIARLVHFSPGHEESVQSLGRVTHCEPLQNVGGGPESRMIDVPHGDVRQRARLEHAGAGSRVEAARHSPNAIEQALRLGRWSEAGEGLAAEPPELLCALEAARTDKVVLGGGL